MAMQRGRNDSKTQRIVVVSNKADLHKLEDEIESIEGDYKRYIAYHDVRNVMSASETLTQVNEILKELRMPSP